MDTLRQTTPRVHLRILIGSGLLWLLVLSACRPTLEEEGRTLLDTDVRFAATSVEQGMAEAFYRFMAPDGMQLRPGEDPLIGPIAIKERMSGREDIILSWIPKAAVVSTSRDLGYTWGMYTVDRTGPEGRVRLGSGKYLNIWRKQPDGSWKVLVDIGNEDPTP